MGHDDPNKTAKFKVIALDDPPPMSAAPATIKSESIVEDRISMEMPSTERSVPVPASVHSDRATLTVLTGFNAGQTFALDRSSSVLGRDGGVADVFIEDAAVSRQHARIWRMPDGRYFIEDLQSTNGTFAGARRIDRYELKQSERVQLGPNVLLRFALVDVTEEELQRRLFESSTRDALTRLYNRKYLMDRLVAEFAHARRHKTELAALMFDLDAFKKLNDAHGHLAGDAALCAVAAQVARLIRVEDVLARYGGEEFVILARSTAHADAVRLGERTRRSVEELDIRTAAATLKVTLSIGVASFSELAKDAGLMDLIGLADTRLYRAKNAGRNRVCSGD